MPHKSSDLINAKTRSRGSFQTWYVFKLHHCFRGKTTLPVYSKPDCSAPSVFFTYKPMIVSNLTTRTGRVVVSQYEIHVTGFTIFQSYSTVIAVRTAYGHVILDRSWDTWGNTTTKYRNKFLGMNTAETRANVASGRFIVADFKHMDLEELIRHVRTACRLNVKR